MKKILLLLLLISGIAEAQIVNIPDANFKAKLLSANTTNTIAQGVAGNNIKIDANDDGQIQLSEALSVYKLNVFNSSITEVTGLQSFPNLTDFVCQNNQLTSLNLSGLSNLNFLNCNGNRLATIDVAPLSMIAVLYCDNNLLTTLDVSNHLSLVRLSCTFNQLVSLNLSGCTNLSSLFCLDNHLTAIDLTDSVLLRELSASSNQLTSLDVTALPNLQYIYLNNNNLTSFDATNQPLLHSLYLGNNQLTELFIKNGINELSGETTFSENPNLRYICADEQELTELLSRLPGMGLTNVNVNSYCDFTPGGDYNTITGKTIFDPNNNGCDLSDVAQPFIKVKINDGTNQGATFTNSTGNYSFYTQAGNFTVTPEVENPSLFTISPANAVVTFPIVDNSVQVENFCISANGIHPDIEIAIAPIVPARPGFPAIYEVVYKNIGNQILNQQYGISFFFNQNLMAFTSSNPAPETQNLGALNWSVANLQPFESRSIYITMNINPPTATNPVNIDDILTLTANAIPAIGETNTQNNTFQFNQTVVGSYDPNDKQCVEGDIVSPVKIGEYLHYLIRFENTGNYYAQNIVVKDVIDETKFEISSLQIMSASHSVEAKVRGNIAEFIFQSINLESGGHGNILLKVKTKSNLTSGTTVSNKADIFFDYNFPIETNQANTTFANLGIIENNLGIAIKMHPNPTDSKVFIVASEKIKSVEIYDFQGRIIRTRLMEENTAEFDLSALASGVYYLKISAENGSKVEKLVKK